MHWPNMDVSQEQVAYLLGIEDDLNKDPMKFAKPLDQLKKSNLSFYINSREYSQILFNEDGQPCISVNKDIVQLERGSGFGDMALMSDGVRMTTCIATTKCCLGTLNRKNFGIILRRASKRKIQQRIAMIKNFTIFSEMTNLKLQKIYYLLQEINLIKGAKIFE